MTIEHPMQKSTRQTKKTSSSLRPGLRSVSGKRSTIAVTTDSTWTNWESRPTKRIMPKNMADQTGAYGIFTMAFGYAMNARPGPVGDLALYYRDSSRLNEQL